VAESKSRLIESGKKYKNGDLPSGIDRHAWRRIFVPTFMTHVARQDNPFENNVTEGLAAMQKIWNILFSDVSYKIVQNGPVYQLVHR
jgi:hypothetical protein